MNYFIQKAKAFARDEEGATAIEYGLLAALVAVVIIAAVQKLGGSLNTTFSDVADKLEAGSGSGTGTGTGTGTTTP